MVCSFFPSSFAFLADHKVVACCSPRRGVQSTEQLPCRDSFVPSRPNFSISLEWVEIKMQFWCLLYICLFSRFDFGVCSFISVCTAQYAELGLISIMRFVAMRIISALMCHFAVSTPDEILNFGTGDHGLWFFSCFVSLPL